MFGFKKKKAIRLVKQKKWATIDSNLEKYDRETKLALIQACIDFKDLESCNILESLVKDSDEEVKVSAIKAIGLIGNEHSISVLQWLLSKVPDSEKSVKETIQMSIATAKAR